MKAIIGLGNPGKKYENTRHNVGFMAVDLVARQCGGTFSSGRGAYYLAKIHLKGQPTLLIKPTTYMNLSGEAALHVINYYGIEDLTDVLIVLDDFNIPFGTLRIRPEGSAGGQNGLKSIIRLLKTEKIPRLRIGIGDPRSDAVSHVLSTFSRKESEDLAIMLQWTSDAISSFIENGIESTMNQYNRNYLT